VGAITDAFAVVAGKAVNVRSVKVAPVLASQLMTWKDWFFVDMVVPRIKKEAQALVHDLEADLRSREGLVLEVRRLGLYGNSEPDGLTEERYLRARGVLVGPGAEGAAQSVEKLIAEGEGPQQEFKSTLRWSLTEEKKDRAVEAAVLKTIAAFLNTTTGGWLLIGVADDQQILGLDLDYATLKKPDRDGFELHLRNIVRSAFGADVARLLNVRFFSVREKDVCAVMIPRSPRPVWVTERGEEEFYVRIGNQSLPLSNRETAEYIQTHWRV